MSDFIREGRYVVIKKNQLTKDQAQYLNNCIFGEGIPTVSCVVVENDWPEFEIVWKMIKDRITGAPVKGGKAEYDTQSQLAALREELATSKRNEHNSEVAYKAAIEKQEELRRDADQFRESSAQLAGDLLGAEQRLADAERRNAATDIESAAKALANCMDYPWEHMPENGRALMRKHAQSIIDATLNPKPEAASHDE